MQKKWFNEVLYNNNDYGYSQSVLIKEPIVSVNSEFQSIEIFENPFFGKVLTLDGVMQTTERDEFFYHEMFVHVPLFFHQNPKKVLIIGGGDGGILREVLKHSVVESVVMVEIDGMVVSLCKEHMPSLSAGAFSNKRAEVIIGDGIDYVKNTNQTFDVIIVDSTDPINCGEVLFTKDFYQNAKNILNDGGIIATQSGVPFFQTEELKNIKDKLGSLVQNFTFYVVPVPTYVGGFMCLSLATDVALELNNKELIAKRVSKDNLSFKYYNADIHIASFALPEYIKKILN